MRVQIKTSARVALVGSGPANIAIAFGLMRRGIDAKDIVVVDAKPPMGQLTRNVESIAMGEMRSGWEVNVTDNPSALRQFAGAIGKSDHSPTPSWDLFRQHSLAVWGSLGIEQLPFQAEKLASWGDNWLVGLADDTAVLETKVVIVATGLGPHRRATINNTIALPLPDNANALYGGERVGIIGAGLTAAHTALFLAKKGCHVTLFAPRGLQTAERDAKMEWFGMSTDAHGCASSIDPQAMQRKLRGLRSKQRYQFIKEGANPGTVTPIMERSLQNLIRQGKITVVQARISDCRRDITPGRFVPVDANGKQYGAFNLVYDAGGHSVHVDNVDRGPNRIAGLRREIGPRHFEGFPEFKDATCQVKPGLVLAGSMTAMEYGPVAHTLAGPVAHARHLAQALPI